MNEVYIVVTYPADLSHCVVGSWIVANGREGPRRCQTIRLTIEPMAMAAKLREGAARLIDRDQSINQ